MSFKEWQKIRLDEVIESVSIRHKFDKDKIILINTSDVLDGKVLNHEYVENRNLKGQFKKSFRKGDILYSEIRPKNKRFAYVDFDSEDYVASTKLMVLRKKSSNINNTFLFQILKSDSFIDILQNLAETRSGTFPQITFSELGMQKVKVPPIEEQKAIAHVLSTLDEKIEVNNQINKTLENMAQAIFKQWFVDFEFPNEDGEPYKSSGGEMVESELGMIPKGWEVMDLSEISTNIITGKTPSTKVKENYGNEIPFVKIPDMHGNVYITKTESYLSKKGVHKNKIIPRNAIIVSCIATPGLVSIASEDCQTNQQINSLLLKDEKMCYFAYFKLIELADYIRTLGSTGSATLNLNKNEFSKIKIVVPEKRLIEKYYQSVKFSFEMILENMKSNEVLRNLRDTLLPKLMSGEIRVPLKEEGEVS